MENKVHLLVTNRMELLDSAWDPLSHEKTVVFMNPWGFSKKAIETQIIQSLKEYKVKNNSKIFLAMRPLFFGRRIEIILNTLVKMYPQNSIVMISVDVPIEDLALNDSSVE
jgi:hypothetical protein